MTGPSSQQLKFFQGISYEDQVNNLDPNQVVEKKIITLKKRKDSLSQSIEILKTKLTELTRLNNEELKTKEYQQGIDEGVKTLNEIDEELQKCIKYLSQSSKNDSLSHSFQPRMG